MTLSDLIEDARHEAKMIALIELWQLKEHIEKDVKQQEIRKC